MSLLIAEQLLLRNGVTTNCVRSSYRLQYLEQGGVYCLLVSANPCQRVPPEGVTMAVSRRPVVDTIYT